MIVLSRWFLNRNKDLLDSALFLILSLFIFFLSTRMDGFGETVLSPGTFPALGAVVLFFLALGLLFKGIRKGMVSAGKDEAQGTRWKTVLVVTLISLVYITVLPLFHFVISTVAFLALFLFYIGERRIWMVGLVSVSTTLVIYFIFGSMLKVLLP